MINIAVKRMRPFRPRGGMPIFSVRRVIHYTLMRPEGSDRNRSKQGLAAVPG